MTTQDLIREKARELLANNEVYRILAWGQSESEFDASPYFFDEEGELNSLLYNDFCGANLSKYLIEQTKKKLKVGVFLKACDTYSFNQLLNEKRISAEYTYPILVGCTGKLDLRKIKECVDSAILKVETKENSIIVTTLDGEKVLENREEYLLEKCHTCKGFATVSGAETIDIENQYQPNNDRFALVNKLEKMSDDERFAFWQGELSKCIRCNACRNVCPACSCLKCVFDNDASGVATKAPADSFEEQMFHIIRAFHVAGRCTDCGECSRVCPQAIPLHLLNRKFIKDSNTLYGEYQAGASSNAVHPLTKFNENDLDPIKAVKKTEGDNE